MASLPKKPSLWVTTTYFAEGFPYMLVRVLSFVFFTDMGVREAWLGFLNFLGIPWNLKFLWAPLVDLVGTKRNWILKIQLLLSLLTLFLSIAAGMAGTEPPSAHLLWGIAFLFIGMAFVGATNDIAIDAYYLEGIPDKKEQAGFSGLRVLAYRIAVVYARIVLIGVAGIANWFWGFGVGAITMALLYLWHRWMLPSQQISRTQNATPTASHYLEAFRSYIAQEKMGLILLFIVTYKLGDEILFSMNTPFLMRELLVSKTQLSWLTGVVGAAATVAGSIFAAWWIKKRGFQKTIWPLTLLMNINIWAYVGLAFWKPLGTTPFGIFLIALVHGYEQWAAGLGSVVLMIYLMRLCKLEFKAAHFAIGSAIMTLGSTFIGGFGGIIVETIGYTNLFILGFLASLPSMALLFWIPLHEEN